MAGHALRQVRAQLCASKIDENRVILRTDGAIPNLGAIRPLPILTRCSAYI
jgi:hypothetical protein